MLKYLKSELQKPIFFNFPCQMGPPYDTSGLFSSFENHVRILARLTLLDTSNSWSLGLMDNSEILGKLVFSSSFGVGRIVSLDKIGSDERQFLVVENLDQKVRSFLPMEDTNTYRFVASKEEMDKLVEGLKDEPTLENFESKKDRINYYKVESQIQDLEVITKLLRELNALTDRGSAENQIFSKLVETMALEHSIINNTQLDDSKEIIKAKLETKVQ